MCGYFLFDGFNITTKENNNELWGIIASFIASGNKLTTLESVEEILGYITIFSMINKIVCKGGLEKIEGIQVLKDFLPPNEMPKNCKGKHVCGVPYMCDEKPVDFLAICRSLILLSKERYFVTNKSRTTKTHEMSSNAVKFSEVVTVDYKSATARVKDGTR
jgi:hypothetical protein